MKTRRVALLGMLAGLAMILSYVESQIPNPVPIPGVKLGLANMAVVFALYSLGFREAGMISLVRVGMVSILFGSGVSLLYSLAGAALALCTMGLLRRTDKFTPVAVSVAGGVMHNVGQIMVACLLLSRNLFFYYLPFLLLSGTVCGAAIGVVSGILVERVKIGR